LLEGTKTPRKVVMVSSTAQDLPEHRGEIRLGCEGAGFEPRMMEHLPALDADAIKASLRMVEEADVYVGIFAYRYGYVPDGYDISITEMEYNHAAKLEKPRLIFFIHGDHPITGRDVETGAGATKLQALKDRIGKHRVAAFFKSPSDLRAHVVEALTTLSTELDKINKTKILGRNKQSLQKLRVFVSYRHSDSRHFTGRLYDRLLNEFDRDYLYMDVATNPFGRSFVEAVEAAVSKCDVLLAIIGPDWLTSCERNGRRHLDKPNDLVRIEILTALQRRIPGNCSP